MTRLYAYVCRTMQASDIAAFTKKGLLPKVVSQRQLQMHGHGNIAAFRRARRV